MSEQDGIARLTEIQQRVDAATKGPWHWEWHDASLQSLSGPDVFEDHVLAVSPCKSCQERAEQSVADGKAICLGPSPDNQAFIQHAREDVPFLLAECARLAAALAEQKQARENDHQIWERRIDDAEAERDAYKRNADLATRKRAEQAEASLAAQAQEIERLKSLLGSVRSGHVAADQAGSQVTDMRGEGQ